MNSSIKTLVALSSLILLALLGAFSYELYAIHQEGEHNAMLEAQVASGQSVAETLNNLRAIQANYTDELGKLDEIFISKDNPVPFLTMLENTGKSLGIKLRILTVTVDAGKASSSKDDLLRLSFETDGSWSQSIAFIHALENLPYHVLIDRSSLMTDIQKDNTEEGAPQHVWRGSYDISLNIQK